MPEGTQIPTNDDHGGRRGPRRHNRFGSLAHARKARNIAGKAKDPVAGLDGVLKELGRENPSMDRDTKGRSTELNEEFWNEQRPPHWG